MKTILSILLILNAVSALACIERKVEDQSYFVCIDDEVVPTRHQTTFTVEGLNPRQPENQLVLKDDYGRMITENIDNIFLTSGSFHNFAVGEKVYYGKDLKKYTISNFNPSLKEKNINIKRGAISIRVSLEDIYATKGNYKNIGVMSRVLARHNQRPTYVRVVAINPHSDEQYLVKKFSLYKNKRFVKAVSHENIWYTDSLMSYEFLYENESNKE